MVTKIGSSTNLVLADLIANDKARGHDVGFELGFFSTSIVALPVAFIGVVYMSVVSPYLLPGHAGSANPSSRQTCNPSSAVHLTAAAREGGGWVSEQDAPHTSEQHASIFTSDQQVAPHTSEQHAPHTSEQYAPHYLTAHAPAAHQQVASLERTYKVSFVVSGAAARQSAVALGLTRLDGAHLIGLHSPVPLSPSTIRNATLSHGRPLEDSNEDVMVESDDTTVEAMLQSHVLGAAHSGRVQSDVVGGAHSGRGSGSLAPLDLGTRILEKGDVLSFSCTADAIALLRRVRGLEALPLSPLVAQLGAKRRRRCLVEVVVGDACPLVKHPLDTRKWLHLYGAAILARRPSLLSPAPHTIQHCGEAVRRRVQAGDRAQSVGDSQVLMAGDTVLLETYPRFIPTWGHSLHFRLVRMVTDSAPPRHGQCKDRVRRVVAGLVFVTVVVLVAARQVSLLVGMVVASYMLVALQCCTIESAFGSIKGRVVLAAVAAFGLGDALTNTGVTVKVASYMVLVGRPLGPTMLLFLIYLTTALLSCLVSNQVP